MHLTNTKIIYSALCFASLFLSSCGGGGSSASGPVKVAYVANYGTNNISEYTIGANGALTLMATVPAGVAPTSVTVDPSGRYAYVANSLDSVISQYTIGAGGGLVPAGSAQSGFAGSGPISVTVDSSGKYAYAANGGEDTVSQFTIVGGALTGMVTVPTGNNSPVFVTVTTDPAGKKYAYVVNAGIPCPSPSGSCVVVVPSISQYSINATNGALTPMSPVPLAAGMAPASITVDPAGKYAYVVNAGTPCPPASTSCVTVPSTISQYKILAGVLTPQSPAWVGGASTALSLATSLAIDPAGKYAYVANGSGVYQYSINSDGTLAEMSTPTIYTGGFIQRSIAVDAGKVYMVNLGSDTISQFSIGALGMLSALNPVSVSTGAVGTQPYSITTAVSIH